ncbi:flagellar hook-associated protein FlgL [Ideonella sp. DXS22W]|uniref:Flagellar hook-associated protein FlgL n=1 Tax=Pseudaquabacterium inlustre TaxID=2984192 RepID=A0ABU9C9Q8_9BURK
MRVSTAYRYDSSIDSLQRRQRDLSEVQASMTNGKRINKTSDDPTGAARAERAYIAQQRIGSDQRSVDASRNAMKLGESTLGQAVELLQSARETIVTAGNATYSPSERNAQVQQLKNFRTQLLALANQDDGAGGFVFGGQTSGTVPFLDTPGGVTLAPTAAAGQTQASTREAMPTTLDGQAIWLSARSGNGVFVTGQSGANSGQAWISAGSVSDPAAITGSSYALTFSVVDGVTTYDVLQDGAPTGQSGVGFVSGSAITVDGMSFTITGQPGDGDSFTLAPSQPELSPFTALDNAISALSDPQATGSQVAQAVSSGLRDMDAVMAQFMSARAQAGTDMNRLDAIDSRNQDRMLWAKTAQASVEDVDMVQAISDYKQQESGYQAALQSYAIVQRMSLLDYLK